MASPEDDDTALSKLLDVTNEQELATLIDNVFLEDSFKTLIDQSLNPLKVQVDEQEEIKDEIDKALEDCYDMVKNLKVDLGVDQAIQSDEEAQVIESGSDSDDDVQFVQTTYEPVKNKQLGTLTQQVGLVPIQPGMHSLLNTQGQYAPVPQQVRVQVTAKQLDLAIGMKLFGKKFNEMWYKGTLVDIQSKERPRSEWRYKIKFDGKGMKVLDGKEVAYGESPREVLPVGSRVIAFYKDEDTAPASSFYAGIVAEPPSVRNNHRYLTFFDDGYAQYCPPRAIHKVYEQSRNVWEDIHPDSQQFIRSYLQQYPERPMVRLQKGQQVRTEWNGEWWTARVQEVDASLVKMYFRADKRVEWVYRGSTRLEPLYTELAHAEASKASGRGGRRHVHGVVRNRRPVVEYTRGAEYDAGKQQTFASIMQSEGWTLQENSPGGVHEIGDLQELPDTGLKRAVAKKSTVTAPRSQVVSTHARRSTAQQRTSRKESASQHERNNLHLDETDVGINGERAEIARRTLPVRNVTRIKFQPHQCTLNCLKDVDCDPAKHKGTNMLLIPMLCQWERQIAKQKNTGKKVVFYRAPCARRLRNMIEVDAYLEVTECKLTIDLFCFDPFLHTDTEYVPVKTFCDIKDLSYGKENVPISCVNGIDRLYPDYMDYSNERLPGKHVQLNTSQDFLTGCDCTDGCRDPNKCACIQLTLEAAKASGNDLDSLDVGYRFRRLKEPVITGIYECNSRCKCDYRCHNRVVQNGLQLRLQVFKTEKKGWGLRCLDDIPAGGFICIYAGQLLTEQGANQDGKEFGDEFLAELDYIEVVEGLKEGYESDVNEDEGIAEGESDVSDAGFSGPPPDDSDSDYSAGEKPVKKKKSAKEKKSDKVDKLVLKRDAASNKTAWTVKPIPIAPKTTQEWVDSIPDEAIVISDEERTNSPADDKGNKRISPPDSPDLGPQVDGAGDEMKETKKEENDDTATDEAAITNGLPSLQITEPTSLNTENVESDDSDDQPVDGKSKAVEDVSFKRTTRSQSSRFSNLPDPRRRKPVSPHKGKVKDDEGKKSKKESSSDGNDEPQKRTTRSYFGEEFCYVMDAKSMGNIGRYLNHSCSPNGFVQNVFVDTHDLRFPWVCFFAGEYVRAGTELTWDYNYEVGSVPDKILFCYCSSADCRGRLL